MKYNADIEFQSLQKQKAFTSVLLADQLNYVKQRSSFYRERFSSCFDKTAPESAFDLLHQLPLTTRQDLEQHNDAFRCRRMSDIAEIVCTSGTTGHPINVYLTDYDLEKLATDEEYAFRSAGITEEDVVQLCVTMDSLFMAGMAYYLGLKRTGCTILRQWAS